MPSTLRKEGIRYNATATMIQPRFILDPLKSHWPLFLVAAVALIASWGQPLLSSHSFRQVQTAQNAQLFLKEGWTPLRTKIRFIPDPGITVLEFPIYQSLMAGITRMTGLPLETTGRLLSLLSGLLLALACAAALRGITPFLQRKGGHIPFSLAALIVFSSPLVFATSQWVSIELMNAAFAASAFVLFGKCLEETRTVKVWVLGLTYGAFALVSLLMKPHGLFAIFPLFLWRYGQEAVKPRPSQARQTFFIKSVLIAALTVVAVAAALAWYRYGEKINVSVHSPYSIANTKGRLMFGEQQIFRLHVLARLAGRFTLYVLGPGTLAFLAFLTIQCRTWIKDKRHLIFAGACLLSIVIYLSIFTGANYYHNYYQVATVFPLYLGIFALVSWTPKRWKAVLAACVLVNLAISAHSLTRQDQYWKEMLAELNQRIPKGYERPTLMVYSNWGASSAVLSYYLERRMLDKPLALLNNDDFRSVEWLGVCDSRENTPCVEILERFSGAKPSTISGPLSLFEHFEK